MQFLVDGVNDGPAVNLTSGTATSGSTVTLAAGSHTVSLSYSGDTTFLPASGNPVTFSVGQAPLTVTAANQSLTYGSALATLTYTVSGFVNGDKAANVLTGAPALSTAAASASGVGSYPISVAAGTLGAANYTIANLVGGTLTVTKTHLTVAANPTTMVYGSAVPALSATITGFVNGDTAATAVTGAPALNTTATSKSHVGTYPITIGTGTLASANYTFLTLSPANLIVTKAPLTVAANPATMVYGSTVPTLSATITGFVNGDTASVVTGAPALSTAATSSSGVGSYPISVGAGTLAATNYSFPNLVSGTLTVSPAVLTVTADPKSMVYGSVVPTLTYTVSGFVNGDTASVVGGSPALTTTATRTSPSAPYPITVGVGSLSAADYSFVVNPDGGNVVVQKAPLTVTANSVSWVKGVASPTLTATITGFVNGDTASVVSGSAALGTPATAASQTGTYTITVGAGTLSAANYTFVNLVNGTLTVQLPPPSLDFVVGSDGMVYTRALDASGNPTGGYALTAYGVVKALAATQFGTGGGSEAFVIGTDNQVYAETIVGASKSGYFATASGSVASISVGTDARGNPLLFAIGTDHQLYAQEFNSSGHATSPSYTKAAYGSFRSAVVTHDAGGNPLLFAVGTDGQVYGLKLNANGTPNGGLFKMAPGGVNQLAVGSNAQGDPVLFVVGLDNYVYWLAADATGSPASGYFAVGGPVESIAVGSDASGDPLLFAIGTDSQVYVQHFGLSGGPTGGFIGTGTGAAIAIAAGVGPNEDPELFLILSKDSQVYTQAFDVTGKPVGSPALTAAEVAKQVVVALPIPISTSLAPAAVIEARVSVASEAIAPDDAIVSTTSTDPESEARGRSNFD